MEKELDPEVIKLTQIALGKYVKRPPLSEKLLRKPPFRFLHDIITTVLKTTGFFDKLFNEEELISDNVKDRDSKITFLTKVIFVLSSSTGKTLAAKPSKIVAGQESEKTNELLQCLAQALDDKISSDKAVNEYNESLKSTNRNDAKVKDTVKTIKKGSDAKKPISKVNDKLLKQKSDVSNKQEKEKINEVKSKRKDNGSTKGGVQAQRTQLSKTVVKKSAKEPKASQRDDTQSPVKKSKLNAKETDKTNLSLDTESTQNLLGKLRSQDSDASFDKVDPLGENINVAHEDSPATRQHDEGNLNASYTIDDNDLNSTASSNDLLETQVISHKTVTESNLSQYNNNIEIPVVINPQENQISIDNNTLNLKTIQPDINTSDKKKSNNLGTNEIAGKMVDGETDDSLNAVKPAGNRGNDFKISHPANVRPSSVRPSSSRPGAPRMREKVDTVNKDTDNLLIGKVNIIVENTPNEEEEDTSLVLIDQADAASLAQDQHDLTLSSTEHGHLVQQILDSQKELSQISGKTEIEWQFGAQKAREAMNQDVEQLRFNIQALSRVANPLGKLLDHIQEDVEVMRQELQQWSNIYEDVSKEMLKQKTINEDSLTPFHTKLKQLESDIEEKHDKINDLKILIHKNASRIEKLLASGNVQ